MHGTMHWVCPFTLSDVAENWTIRKRRSVAFSHVFLVFIFSCSSNCIQLPIVDQSVKNHCPLPGNDCCTSSFDFVYSLHFVFIFFHTRINHQTKNPSPLFAVQLLNKFTPAVFALFVINLINVSSTILKYRWMICITEFGVTFAQIFYYCFFFPQTKTTKY